VTWCDHVEDGHQHREVAGGERGGAILARSGLCVRSG